MNSQLKKLLTVGVVATLGSGLFGVTAAHAAAPPNDNFIAAQTLAASGTLVGSNTGATAQLNEPATITGDPFATVWYTWKAPTSGTVTFDTFGTDIDTVMSVYTGTTFANVVEVGSNDDGFGCDSTSQVVFNAVANTSYKIQVGSTDPSATTDTLHLTWNWGRGARAANDDFAAAVPITGTQSVHGTTSNSTPETNLPAVFEADTDSSVWYKVAAVVPTSVDLALVTGTAPNAFGNPPTVSGEVWAGATPSTLSFVGVLTADAPGFSAHQGAGGNIWIRILSSQVCDQGTFTLNASVHTGTAVTTMYDPGEYQGMLSAATKLGWTPEQLQHDSVLIWQFIYALSGITTPTPISPPVPGSVAVTSVFTSAEMTPLNLLNAQWVLPSTHTQRVATNITVFVVGLSG